MTDAMTIYVSGSDEAIERLAVLDSAEPPRGHLLVAAVGGRPVAALPLDGGPAIADPFEQTAEVVAMLRLRLAQMHARPSRARGAGFAAALRDLVRGPGGLTVRA